MVLELGKYSVHVAAGWLVAGGFLTALLVTWVSIPTILKVAMSRGLYDRPNKRSSHKREIPTLGGMAVFAGFTIAVALFAGLFIPRELLFLFAGLIILFFIGIKDDILMIDPVKKLLGQIVAAAIVIILGDIRMTGFYGFLGIWQIPYWAGVLFTIFVFVVVINGMNLIDGIDGLASGTGILASVAFGVWFLLTGHAAYAVISFSLAGSLIAFLRFNLSQGRHKIFLGDTGSLIVGLLLGVLAVRFMEYNRTAPAALRISSPAVVAFTVLILPMIDTLHVFILRILRGRSPFEASRWHLHHRLLDLGLSHIRATGVLLSINLLFILLAYWLQDLGDLPLLGIILGLALLLTLLSYGLIRLKRHKGHIPAGREALDV